MDFSLYKMPSVLVVILVPKYLLILKNLKHFLNLIRELIVVQYSNYNNG